MITIYGASDDLVEVGGCKGADEFGVPGVEWSAELIAPDGSQMAVYARYEGNGCWSVGASQVDEDIPFAPWPVTIRAAQAGADEPHYSAAMDIDAPEGTRLTNVRDGA